jgi:hypothetical protein
MEDLEVEGFVKLKTWRITTSATSPTLEDDERVITEALVERGFSFRQAIFSWSW